VIPKSEIVAAAWSPADDELIAATSGKLLLSISVDTGVTRELTRVSALVDEISLTSAHCLFTTINRDVYPPSPNVYCYHRGGFASDPAVTAPPGTEDLATTSLTTNGFEGTSGFAILCAAGACVGSVEAVDVDVLLLSDIRLVPLTGHESTPLRLLLTDHHLICMHAAAVNVVSRFSGNTTQVIPIPGAVNYNPPRLLVCAPEATHIISQATHFRLTVEGDSVVWRECCRRPAGDACL